MIEISAKLLRGSVYFNNEQLKCLITYRNVGNNVESLAWSGAQVHCHSSLDETKVICSSKTNEILEEELAFTSKETSFHPCKGEKGRLIFSTNPKILFCDLTLQPNDCKTFLYEETIPHNCPPSFYGSWIKYICKLTIGTQRVNCVIQLLRMPLRVLSLLSTDEQVNFETKEKDQNDAIINPNNTYFEYENKDNTIDVILYKLDCLTGKRSPSSYLITNQMGKVARLCLLKSTFKLGEDVVGFFDFSESTIPCVQFSVTLQSEEILKEEVRAKSVKSTQVSNHSKYHEFCLHLNNTQMILPIPLTVTPAFQTDLMILSWKLHFEFVTTKIENLQTEKVIDSQGTMEQSPSDLKVQTMVWDLPINILPAHPLQVGRALQMPATMSITV